MLYGDKKRAVGCVDDYCRDKLGTENILSI
jgi:hypothetical protein